MVTVRIGNETRKLDEADESWINQQIARRRRDNQVICVEITVNTNGLNMRLATPACGNGGGAGRPPNNNEREVFELWEKRRLNSIDFTGGNLVAFLKQLSHMIG